MISLDMLVIPAHTAYIRYKFERVCSLMMQESGLLVRDDLDSKYLLNIRKELEIAKKEAELSLHGFNSISINK